MLVLVLVAAGLPARAADDGRDWTTRFDGAGDQVPYALAADPGGARVYVAGQEYLTQENGDAFVRAYHADSGADAWSARIAGPDGEGFNSLAPSPDGATIFVAGGSEVGPSGHSSGQMLTVAYDAHTGAPRWEARQGRANEQGGAAVIKVSADGARVFVSGTVWAGSVFGFRYLTVAYDAKLGRKLWEARYDGPVFVDQLEDLVVSPDAATVYVTGWSWGGFPPQGSGFDFVTIAYDAATGRELWTTRFDGGMDLARRLLISPDGTVVYVLGNYPDRAPVVVAHDAATGAVLWQHSIGGLWGLLDAQMSADGARIFTAGYIEAAPIDPIDLAVSAVDAHTGEQVWATTYDGAAANDYARALSASPDGATVFAAGTSEIPRADFDVVVVAMDAATGARRWVARIGSAGEDTSAGRVAVSAHRVFFAGESKTLASGWDAVTGSLALSTCSDGSDERGPVSGIVQNSVEPVANPLQQLVQHIDCDVVVRAGL